MNKKNILINIIILGVVAGCRKDFPSTIEPTGVEDETTFISQATSTEIPTHILETEEAEKLVQLTYITYEDGFSKPTVNSILVGCFNSQVPCIGKPNEMFTLDLYISDLTWSPDGTKLAIVASEEPLGFTDIYILDPDGNNLINITNNNGLDAYPVWSPDSSKIIYSSIDDDGLHIFLTDNKGNNKVNLFSSLLDYEPVVWDWYENKVLYTAYDKKHVRQVYLTDIENSYIDQLTDSDSFLHNTIASTSPDGRWVATNREAYWPEKASEKAPHALDIILINLGEGTEVNLTKNSFGEFNMRPKWSPMGNWLAVSSGERLYQNIVLMALDGIETIDITTELQITPLFSWRIFSSFHD